MKEEQTQRTKFGLGDKALANYVRKFHPHLIEESRKYHAELQDKRTEALREGLRRYHEANAETTKVERVKTLLDKLRALGVKVGPVTIEQGDTQHAS